MKQEVALYKAAGPYTPAAMEATEIDLKELIGRLDEIELTAPHQIIVGRTSYESVAWAVATTDHAASSYGQPVVVIDGVAHGPGDIRRLGLIVRAAPSDDEAFDGRRSAMQERLERAGYPTGEATAR